MTSVFEIFTKAHLDGDGYRLASAITPEATQSLPNRLEQFVRSSNPHEIQTDARYATIYSSDLSFSKAEANAWVEVLVAFYRAATQLVNLQESSNRSKDTDWSRVYDAWKEVSNALINGYTKGSFAAWTIPCLYVSGKYLRTFAIRADEQTSRTKGDVTFNAGLQDDVANTLERNEKLEDAARQINRIFSLCISDRAPIEESCKWGLYYITNLLFKTYFKLNSISLSGNILRSLKASATDMPPLSAFPKSHIVTFEYYVGVIHFLDEDFAKAEEHLMHAYTLCQRAATKNRALILTYLIPCRLMTSHLLPTAALLAPHPALAALFAPLAACIRRGDLAGFDAALAAGQAAFVRRRIYLTLERGRDVALRNLFRRVFLAGGFVDEDDDGGGGGGGKRLRRTRIPVADFVAGMKVGLAGAEGAAAQDVERDEVECLIANLIYKNLMKGYISREHAKVVLPKSAVAFPGTGV